MDIEQKIIQYKKQSRQAKEAAKLSEAKIMFQLAQRYAEKVQRLELALQDSLNFALWVECLGRTDCEIYKHELRSAADLAIERIESALEFSK